MGHTKYLCDEEAKEAMNQQRKKFIEKIGIIAYREMVRKMSLDWFYKNRGEINRKKRDERKQKKEKRVQEKQNKPIEEKYKKLTKFELIERLKQFE